MALDEIRFLEKLNKTVEDNQEPKESLLEVILKPKYEIPGLSAYSRAVGRLSEILDAPIEKEREQFAERYGISREDVPSAVGGTSLGMILGQPALSSIYITPGDIPPMLAPASGDPETGEYSNLDVGFAVADVASLGATKAVRGIGRKVFDDFSDVVKSSRMRKMEKQMAKIEAEAPGTLATGEDYVGGVGLDISREEALSQGLPVDVETGTILEGWSPTGPVSASERGKLIKAGVFETTGIEELSHLEDFALEGGAIHGVKLLPPKGKFRNLDVSNIKDETAVIVIRKKAITETGIEINRNILIGRRKLGSTDHIKMSSFSPKTGEVMTNMEFKLNNIGGKKLLEDSSFFQVGESGTAKMHSGVMMNDFIANVLRNDWIIGPNNEYTFDSLLPLIQRAVSNKMQIIFNPSYSRMSSSGGGHSKWGNLSFTAMVNERGEFVGEGLDTVFKELEDQIKLGEKYGGIVGKPEFQKLSSRTLTRSQLTPVAREKIIKEHGAKKGKEIIEDMINEYKFIGKPDSHVISPPNVKPIVTVGDIRKIGYEKKFKGSIEITYNSMTIKKLKGMVAGALGMSSAKEFDEFLNYNPESMEAQVFDNEQLF
jgi:hypothetical protein